MAINGQRISQSLSKTRAGVFRRIRSLFGQGALDEAAWEELEILLLQADVGVSTTTALLNELRRASSQKGAVLRDLLRQNLEAMLSHNGRGPRYPAQGSGPLWVVLVVGVNGSGKTTSIAKLAHYHQQRSRRVLLAAGDTFRAAAIEQLKVWGVRLDIPVVAHQPGADPGAVVYDAIQAALGRGVEVLIIDTAGRLHTKYNLMEELKKIQRVIARQVEGAPQEVLLVLDAATGQNALAQALHFHQALGLTGIFLAKLDGTAKGGIVFAIARELGTPIQYVGTGEQVEDIAEFDAHEFVEGLLSP